jgi:hypothetical protein
MKLYLNKASPYARLVLACCLVRSDCGASLDPCNGARVT